MNFRLQVHDPLGNVVARNFYHTRDGLIRGLTVYRKVYPNSIFSLHEKVWVPISEAPAVPIPEEA